MNNDTNTESFLSATMRSAESIISKSTATAKHYLGSIRDLKESYKKASELKQIAPMAKSAPGSVGAHMTLVLGWVVLGLGVLIGLVEYLLFHAHWPTLLLTMLLPILLGILLLYNAITKIRYINTYQIFRTIFSEHPYMAISKLAQRTRMSKSRVIKYLQEYESEGLYPQGHFYHNDTYYVMSDQAARLLEESLRERANQKERKSQEKILEEEYPKLYTVAGEIDETVQALGTIGQSTTAKKNPELKRELGKMRRLLSQTKEYIVKNPDDVPDISGFIDYFLPTVTKLLGTYYELDNETIQTENVRTSKAEIESVLGSINKAFENMYDDFYTDRAIDVYSDVSVLKTMIQQHGFSDSDFEGY